MGERENIKAYLMAIGYIDSEPGYCHRIENVDS
jgi:hypothetical protein